MDLERKIIYVAGPYSGEDYHSVRHNINEASKAAIQLWQKGWVVICPHKNTAGFEAYDHSWVEHGRSPPWLAGDLEILRRCDAIFLLSTWLDSEGARAEYEFAVKLYKLVYFQKDGYPLA